MDRLGGKGWGGEEKSEKTGKGRRHTLPPLAKIPAGADGYEMTEDVICRVSIALSYSCTERTASLIRSSPEITIIITSRRRRYITITENELVSTEMGDRLWAAKPSRYVTSQLGRLDLLPPAGP